MSLSERELIARAVTLEPRFEALKSCSKCGRAFCAEIIWRRLCELKDGLALAVLCDACESALPKSGAANTDSPGAHDVGASATGGARAMLAAPIAVPDEPADLLARRAARRV